MRVEKCLVVFALAVLAAAVACSSSSEPAAPAAGKTAGAPAGNVSPAAPVDAGSPAGDATASAPAAPTPVADPKSPVVTINGTVITNGEVAAEQDRVLKQVASQHPQGLPPAMATRLRKQIIDMMVNRTLVEQAAKSEKIEVSPAEIEAEMKKIREQFPEAGALEKELASNGMTEAELKEQIRQKISLDKLVQAHEGTTKPTDEEIKAFYDQNSAKMNEPEKVRASHVLVKVEKTDSDEVKKQKKQKIEEVQKKIAGGADFAEVAKQDSDCPSKSKGGDLGFFPRGQMAKPFEDAAFAMKKGDTSGIVETEFGYHVIRVTDRVDAKSHSLDEMKEKIGNYLQEQKRGQGLQKYLSGLRGKAKIEYAPGEGPDVPPPPKPAGEGLPPGHPPVASEAPAKGAADAPPAPVEVK